MAPSSWHRGQESQEHGDGVVDASLLARVQAHDAFFCEMVDLIPPELYLPKDEEEEETKYYKNKRQAAPKQEKKEASKKGKRVKFDPANMKSVTQLQKERADKEKEKRRKAEAGESSDAEDEDEDEEEEEEHSDGPDSDGSEGDEGMEVEEDEDEEKEEEEDEEEEEEKAASGVPPHKGEGESSSSGGGGKTKGGKAGRGPLSLAGTTPRAKSIEELRERLRLRIEEARARRGGAPGGSKREGKGQKAEQRQGKKGGAGHHPQAKPPQHKGAPSAAAAAAAAAQASPLNSGGAGRRPSEQALDIQFGKIAVPAQGPERLRLKKGGKNLVGLLQKAEEKERRLKELQASEKGKDQAQALLWKDALKSAHGGKVLDNPKLLKKAIKRKQKLKERSARKWDARKQAQEAAGRERQEKREANLKKRKAGPGGGAEAAAAGKEWPDGAKKQRRAGFEGKRHGHEFLNGSGGGGGGGGGKGPAGAGKEAAGMLKHPPPAQQRQAPADRP